MANRRLEDWLRAYMRYASVTEAPKKMHAWAGLSALAGALRRKVWIDQVHFKWYANLYIIFVAPPGVVSKTTTGGMAMKLLKRVPGIKFGPDVVTWPALVEKFAASCESFQYGEEFYPMSALTLFAGEMGSLIDLQDTEMVNLYITLWDGADSFEKVTKTNGQDVIEGTWINMIACTTPQWLAEKMPTVAVGGGFTSRCIFIYADQKERFIPFVDEVTTADVQTLADDLVHDLEHISVSLVGPITISKEARDWYRPVYEEFWKTARERMDTAALEGYAARKQTLLFKTAMLLSVARSDALVISSDDLQLAHIMLEELEDDTRKVFSKIGKGELAFKAEHFIEYVKRHDSLPFDKAYAAVHMYFPDVRDFTGILEGAVRSGQLQIINAPQGGMMIKYTGPK